MTDLTQRVLQGETAALARATTLVEERSGKATALLQQLFPHTGKALIVGFAGPPEAGKSTIVDQIARLLRREGISVALILVDPTSPY